MPPQFCSPLASDAQDLKESCLNYDMLVLLARLYNAKQSRSDLDKIPIPKRKSATKLWKALQAKLDPVCGKAGESCWVEQPFVKSSPHYDKITKMYRPKKPLAWYKEERKWLNTYDIQDVMTQYAEADPSFKFVGVFPADFAARTYPGSDTCIVNQMCKLDLTALWADKVKTVGVVFNTDDSKSPGQHWVSMFVGLNPRGKNFGVFFYDSVANAPQKEFVSFMETMRRQLEALHPKHAKKIRVEHNMVQRQYKNYDCGVFSMLFLISMLKRKFEDVCEGMGYDDDVAKFRDILYRPSVVPAAKSAKERSGVTGAGGGGGGGGPVKKSKKQKKRT